MVKKRLLVQEEPVGNDLYVVDVLSSISKQKVLLVYADYYIIDDIGNVAFFINSNKGIGGEIVVTIAAGNWNLINKFEDIDQKYKCVRFQTLQERLDEILMLELEKEEAEKKVPELKVETQPDSPEEKTQEKTKSEELEKSIK